MLAASALAGSNTLSDVDPAGLDGGMRPPAITKVGWGFDKCNEHCQHCYNASGAERPTLHSEEALLRAADRILASGQVRDINYGSGELAVNPHAVTLIEYVRAQFPHVRQALTSNGYSVVRLGPRMRHFDDVDVSLDVPDADRHNRFRGHPRAWEWVLEALSLLKQLELPRTVVTCVTAETTDADLEGLLRLAEEQGAQWRISWYRHTGRGPDALRITARRAWEVIAFLSRSADFVCMDSVFGGVLGVPSEPCPAGHSVCRIQDDLTVTPYPFLKGPGWIAGDLTRPETTLEHISRSEPMTRLRARAPRLCSRCPFLATCRGGCASRAFLHRNALDAPDDFCPTFAGLNLSALQQLPVRLAERSLTPDAHTLVHDGYLCTTIVRPRGLPQSPGGPPPSHPGATTDGRDADAVIVA